VWLRDARQVLLVDPAQERAWALEGVEAAIWDWLTLDYADDQIVVFLSLLLKTSAARAARRLRDVLRAWQAAGILQVVEEDQRDQSGH
jgi:hypothetical protein